MRKNAVKKETVNVGAELFAALDMLEADREIDLPSLGRVSFLQRPVIPQVSTGRIIVGRRFRPDFGFLRSLIHAADSRCLKVDGVHSLRNADADHVRVMVLLSHDLVRGFRPELPGLLIDKIIQNAHILCLLPSCA